MKNNFVYIKSYKIFMQRESVLFSLGMSLTSHVDHA